MSVVGQIAELMPPPASAVVASPWDEAPSEVGFAFPADYREFVDLYGAGSINDEFCVEVPTLRPAGAGMRTGFGGFVDQSAAVLGSGIGEMWRKEAALVDGQRHPFRSCPIPVA